MAITFALVDAAPYRLRYLATQDGVISSPPVSSDGFDTIDNDVGATPDLSTDINTVAVSGGGQAPLKALIYARRNGNYKAVTTGALTQAEARALLNSDDAAGAVLTNQNVGRCVTSVTPRTGAVAWATDINVDGNGDPIIEVRSTTGTAGTAYVDLHYRHTANL
jgi:hypothetical protein